VRIKITNAYEKDVNLLRYNRSKPTACFSHILWPSSGGCFYKGYITKTHKQILRKKKKTTSLKVATKGDQDM